MEEEEARAIEEEAKAKEGETSDKEGETSSKSEEPVLHRFVCALCWFCALHVFVADLDGDFSSAGRRCLRLIRRP